MKCSAINFHAGLLLANLQIRSLHHLKINTVRITNQKGTDNLTQTQVKLKKSQILRSDKMVSLIR